MNWIKVGKDNFVNLDKIFYIWIQPYFTEWYLVGSLIHNDEEVRLSENFHDKDECMNYAILILRDRLRN